MKEKISFSEKVETPKEKFEKYFKKKEMKIGEETLEYVDFPPEKKESPYQRAFLSIPGFGSTAEMWREPLFELYKLFPSTRFVCYTPLGMEGSSTPKNKSFAYTHEILKEFFEGLDLPEDLTIVSHSKGDMEALSLIQDFPEEIKRVVLANPALRFRNFFKLVGKVFKKMPSEAVREPLVSFQLLKGFLKGTSLEGLFYQTSSLAWGRKLKMGKILKDFPGEVLIILGTEDIFPYEKVPKISNEKIEKRLVVGGGHHFPFHQPEALALTIKSWLEKTEK